MRDTMRFDPAGLPAARMAAAVAPHVQIVAPAPGDRVSGVVKVLAKVTGGTPSSVRISVGKPSLGLRTAVAVGGGLYSYDWDTTKKMVDNITPVAGDALYWIRAEATISGTVIDSEWIPAVTANTPQTVPAGGWREATRWAAKYDGTLAQWHTGQSAVIGEKYASLVDDPKLGATRKVLRASVPDSARGDADQTNLTTVRFQSAAPRKLLEGDEICVGFSFMPGTDFPTVYPKNDPANPNGKDATGYIALFQFYGPPYEQGSPLVFQAIRSDIHDPLDEFTINGNELNPGDPGPLLSLPYNRGRWTDIVFRMHLSRSIEHGWMEIYTNQGEARKVQPVPLFNGFTRLPRVFLRANSEAFRTDMQIYRVAGRIPSVTVHHTGHKVAQTVAEADPGSYRSA